MILVTPTELSAAVRAARPGEMVVLRDGAYRDQKMTIEKAIGAPGKPITIRAQTPGRVVFSGASSLEIENSSQIVVSGLVFERGTAEPLLLRDTQQCRVTDCAVIECNPLGAQRLHWIRIAGARSERNRVDHCFASGKRKDGVVLTVEGAEGKMPQHTRVDHCHFKDVIRAVSNGMETIRVGTSGFAQLDSHTIVEFCLFENASGDAEIISSKSCANVYRNNTFVGCDGGVVMRHGHRSVIENNIFLGNGQARTAGVRVHGTGHIVRNNYFAGLGQYSLALPAGQSKFVPTGHEPTINCRLERNTIVEPAGPAIVLGADKSATRDTAPAGSVFASNLVSGAKGALIQTPFTGPATWTGNVVFASGTATTGITTGGIRSENPRLARDAKTGLWHGAALPTVGANNKELGAPLRPVDVGPAWRRR